MFEGNLSKFGRVVRGGVADAVESFENRNALRVMREAAREIEREIDETKGKIGRQAAQRVIAGKQEASARAKIGELTEKARIALAEQRSDLAEALVARQLELEAQIPRLIAFRKEAAEVEEALQQALAGLEARKHEMNADIAAVAECIEDTAALDAAASGTRNAPRTPGEPASRAFERAKAALAKYPTLTSATADTAGKLAEFDVLNRKREIAERIARLRGEGEA